MHFCTECQNMYYTRLGGENQNSLIYYCRKCGHQDDLLATNVDNMCISKTQNFKNFLSTYGKRIYTS